ncbi:MAG: LPXTG cell wall anchor domain-containing protein, partial [Clostridia bacterium]|nr:LPXTG cell wall anchor domain-containing protein [Clostridia bacterium]
IYVFENIPYGKYTYTELEAPEEYIIDTEAHEVTIDAEEMKLQITNEKLQESPETGDIQVVTLAVVSIISIAGIVYVLKNKKQLVK